MKSVINNYEIVNWVYTHELGIDTIHSLITCKKHICGLLYHLIVIWTECTL